VESVATRQRGHITLGGVLANAAERVDGRGNVIDGKLIHFAALQPIELVMVALYHVRLEVVAGEVLAMVRSGDALRVRVGHDRTARSRWYSLC
jgi:hypothetical protein